MGELTGLLREVSADDHVRYVVLYGGPGQFFSAGGDFNETTSFTRGDEVGAWIEPAKGLYRTILGVGCPVIAAIDQYAVGLGLQKVLSCDFRIGSDRAWLMMPELQAGISCNLGAYMLETVVGRPVMQKMIYRAVRWPASGLQIYGQGVMLSSEALAWRHEAELDDDDGGASGAKHDPWGPTSMEMRCDIVRMRTGPLNDLPPYLAQKTATRAWAVGTDVFQLHARRAQ